MRFRVRKQIKHNIYLFKVIKWGIKVVWNTMPCLFIINNIVTIICGIAFGMVPFVTQELYDSVTNIISNHGAIHQAYFKVLFLSLLLIIKEILNGINLFLDNLMNEKANCTMSQIIHKKMSLIDPIFFEDTHFFEDIEKATAGSKSIIYIVNMGIGFFTFNLPYFIVMWFYLKNLKPEFVLTILLIFLPVILTQFVRTGIIAKFEDESAPIRRETDYYIKTITEREYYKETRKLGAYSFFMERLLEGLGRLSKVEWKMNKRTNGLELLLSIASVMGYVGILYMLVASLLAGQITIGAFAAVFDSINMLFNIISEMVNHQIGEMSKKMGTAYNFINFIELPERQGKEDIPIFEKGIIAHNISFAYPNAKYNSIENVSVDIKAGETVAIVGENGSGKTTLVRLLIGLYTPTEGKVILNGLDTSGICSKSLFFGVSGVFQKFRRYQMTLKDNIRISDMDNRKKINKIAKQAGIDIANKCFVEAENTMLSREFEGVELSGGQWQRVAIARGLYRFHKVIVLDEPTAAIDPIEESRIYHKFIEISKAKTAIIVTHRLGAVKLADRIIVMNQGKVIAIGTHYELLEKCPVYTEMYNAQAGWYTLG